MTARRMNGLMAQRLRLLGRFVKRGVRSLCGQLLKGRRPFVEPARLDAGFKSEAAFAAHRATFLCLKNTRAPAWGSKPSDQDLGMGLVER
jgi:hypothetical protein